MAIQTLTRDNPICGTRPGTPSSSSISASTRASVGSSRRGGPIAVEQLFALPGFPVSAEAAASVAAPVVPRTEAGRRAAQRRRARVSADRRPPSGMLPSSHRTSAVVTADHGDEVDHRQFRMGRWARLVSTLSVLSAAAVLGAVLLSSGGSPFSGGTEVIGQVTVAPGDTLWSIAQQADPGADTGAVVERIRDLNGLGGDAIAAGAVLQVPTAG